MDKEIELKNHIAQSATLRPNYKESQEGKPGILVPEEITAKTKGEQKDFDGLGNMTGPDEKAGNNNG